MPVLSFGHSKFWRARANPVTPPAPTLSGYPLWQASVISGSVFGMLQVLWDILRDAIRIAWDTRYLTPDQRRAVYEVLRIVRLQAWPVAQRAVYDTARLEGFHEPRAWAEVGASLRDRPHWAENTWRHMAAMKLLEDRGCLLPNPERNLLIELAYHEYAASGRGKPTMDR